MGDGCGGCSGTPLFGQHLNEACRPHQHMATCLNV